LLQLLYDDARAFRSANQTWSVRVDQCVAKGKSGLLTLVSIGPAAASSGSGRYAGLFLPSADPAVGLNDVLVCSFKSHIRHSPDTYTSRQLRQHQRAYVQRRQDHQYLCLCGAFHKKETHLGSSRREIIAELLTAGSTVVSGHSRYACQLQLVLLCSTLGWTEDAYGSCLC